jgi:ABC-type antimicrobial peptide transport system permease subunit
LWSTIVGVVGNVRSQGLDEVEQEAAYLNYWQYPTEVITLYLKSSLPSDELANVVAALVRDIDPRQTLETIQPLNDVKSAWLAPAQLRGVLIAMFGILALVVTLSGVIGVVSYNISQRVREIGVHMAIGANPANIVTMFVKQGLKVYACGLLLGLGLMLFTAPLLEPLLYQTAIFHTGIYVANIVLLTFAVLLAMYLPARRAALMSPVTALHCE